MLNKRLISLRKKIRQNSKKVIDTLINNHCAKICLICGTTKNLTKEHVLPKWIFENNQRKQFITNINGLNQSYSKTTVYACSECNSYILGSLERHIEIWFRKADLGSELIDNEIIEKVIIWLEFIDYKFQVLNLRRKFKKVKDGEYVPYLAKIPLRIMQNISISPSRIFSNLRNSLKRLSIKSKANKMNSLIIFKTTNKSFYFFHKMNEFIFIELPKHEVAFFYFYVKEFDSPIEAHNHAMKHMKTIY